MPRLHTPLMAVDETSSFEAVNKILIKDNDMTTVSVPFNSGVMPWGGVGRQCTAPVKVPQPLKSSAGDSFKQLTSRAVEV